LNSTLASKRGGQRGFLEVEGENHKLRAQNVWQRYSDRARIFHLWLGKIVEGKRKGNFQRKTDKERWEDPFKPRRNSEAHELANKKENPCGVHLSLREEKSEKELGKEELIPSAT